jgi:hypothetical protein
MEHEARADDGIDNWLIGHFRQQPRRTRGEEVVERMLRPRAVPDVVTRLEALEDAIAELDVRLEALELARSRPVAASPLPERIFERELRLEPPLPEPDPGHTFFVPTAKGYEIVAARGEAPAVGASVTIDGRSYTVEASRRSPLPLDPRPCLVLARGPAANADAAAGA